MKQGWRHAFPGAVLTGLFDAAVRRVHGWDLLVNHGRCADDCLTLALPGEPPVVIPLPVHGRVVVAGAGKAAAALAQGLEACLGDRIADGLIIVKYGHGATLEHIRVREAGHPVPDNKGLAATSELLAMVKGLGAQDLVLVVITGGASALLVQPVEGLSLRDKEIVTGLLLRSGASIGEINTVRKRLSRVKGGGLLRAAGSARVVTLLISDIVGDDVAMIGSGPTIACDDPSEAAWAVICKYDLAARLPGRVRDLLTSPGPAASGLPAVRSESHILANSTAALAAARARAVALGHEVEIVDAAMVGNTHDQARAFGRAIHRAANSRPPGAAPVVLLAAGETTLVVQGTGKGGRNQEFALVLAGEISGMAGVAALVAGTDGSDGPTDAAGAFVDGDTLGRAQALGENPQARLANNDAYRFFAALDELFVTGATGTNVMDLVAAILF